MLEIDDLHSGYGSSTVLRGVSLVLPAGRIVALLGRNGMGKTTLIRSIMGFREPRCTAGSIRLNNVELRGLRPHEIARLRVGLVPQGRRLFPSLTVLEHLTMLGTRPGAAWTVERVFQIFPRLAERRRHLGTELSGGERQMLAVARALMTDPLLLLMDEPSEGLSPVLVEHLETTMKDLRDAGLTILLVEQNLFSALAVADDVFIMETGSIVYQGGVEDFRKNPDIAERYLGVH
jgi:branched-chain amino acid transport system ATP-binding protein